jgi:antitoxin FitA
MAMIQIRDVPEDVYETIRRRARRAGQSIQAYMLAHTVDFARRRTPAEVTSEIQADLASRPAFELDIDEVLRDIDDGRP